MNQHCGDEGFNDMRKKLKVEEVFDRESSNHVSGCSQLPGNCFCPRVHWIWAQLGYGNCSINPGKWMIFAKQDDVAFVWSTIVEMLRNCQLGSCAKVSPRSGRNNTYLICVYTCDHEDVAEIMRVLLSLRDTPFLPDSVTRGQLLYKTDEDTYGAVYASDAAAQTAGFVQATVKKHHKETVSKYISSKLTGPPALVPIQLILCNVGPQFDRVVVAERHIGDADVVVHCVEEAIASASNSRKNVTPRRKNSRTPVVSGKAADFMDSYFGRQSDAYGNDGCMGTNEKKDRCSSSSAVAGADVDDIPVSTQAVNHIHDEDKDGYNQDTWREPCVCVIEDSIGDDAIVSIEGVDARAMLPSSQLSSPSSGPYDKLSGQSTFNSTTSITTSSSLSSTHTPCISVATTKAVARNYSNDYDKRLAFLEKFI